MNSNYLIIIISLLLISKTIQSQTQIRGTVYESELGDKLDSVVVQVEGTDICSMTDSSGNYKIAVPSEKSYLLFTRKNYDKLYVKARRCYEINIVMASLQTETQNINVGYGTQRSNEITGAVSSIGGGVARPRSYVESTKKIKK